MRSLAINIFTYFIFLRLIYFTCKSPPSITLSLTSPGCQLPWLGSRWNVGVFPRIHCGWWFHGYWEKPSGTLCHGEAVILCKAWIWADSWDLGKVVEEMLPNDLGPQLTFHNIQWEIVICLLVIALLVGLFFLFRLVQLVRSWLCVRSEKQLSDTLTSWIREKFQLADKLRVTKKEHKGIKSFSENARGERVFKYN